MGKSKASERFPQKKMSSHGFISSRLIVRNISMVSLKSNHNYPYAEHTIRLQN
jgi:hypothetical protein